MSRDNPDEIEELRRQLEEWNMGLDELQSRIEREEADERHRLRERIRKLRESYDETMERFTARLAGDDDLAERGTESWEAFPEGLAPARKHLADAREACVGVPRAPG
jgi:predicted nuclease with TOPRIM domain